MLGFVSRYGKAIDKHGIVVRMNVAPTKGFEDKVGSKTTFRLLNNKHATAITRYSFFPGFPT